MVDFVQGHDLTMKTLTVIYGSAGLPLTAALCCLSLPVRSQSVPQFQLSAPASLTNGSFGFALSAPLGRTYVIEASTNATAWNPVITNTAPAGSASVVDTNAPQFQHRFYRGKLYWTVIVPNIYPAWQTNGSGNGRLLTFPAGWTTAHGTDGRTIAFPSGWNTAQGSDGRMIAFPSGFTNKQGADGRLVAYLATGFSTVQSHDGRIIALPLSGWTNVGGGDGRQIAFPTNNFATNQGLDGRVVALPALEWTTSHGGDARNVAYLSNEFVTAQGVDGRDIAYPPSAWTTLQGPDGRETSYPASISATIELDFQDQSLFALLGNLQTLLSPANFNDYVIYTFFGTGEQQFDD